MLEHYKQPHIVTSIKTIGNLVKKYGDSHLKEIGLTHSQTNVIVFLHQEKHRKIQQRDIERALNLTNPTVSALLTRLEEKEFIKRVADPVDNRSRIIELTDKVDPILEGIYEHLSHTERLLFQGLSEQEIETLSNPLKKIAINAAKLL